MDIFFARREQPGPSPARRGRQPGGGVLAVAIRAEKAAYAADRDRTPEWTLGASMAAPKPPGTS